MGPSFHWLAMFDINAAWSGMARGFLECENPFPEPQA
jgi:hypothetical protein